jgi:hypothetical protein
VGHLIFCCLHFIALLCGGLPLVLTIPAHLMYGVATEKQKTHVRCPACREFVLKDADLCERCGRIFVTGRWRPDPRGRQ